MAVGASAVGCGSATNSLGRTNDGYYDTYGDGRYYTNSGAAYWDTDGVTNGRMMNSVGNTMENAANDVKMGANRMMDGTNNAVNRTTASLAN